MFARIFVILTLIVCCYCLDKTDQSPEEARAKKKKGSLRIIAIIAMAVLAKIVITKAITFVAFVAFFQKLFYIGGLLLNHFMKTQKPPAAPQVMYGPPQDYNTVGYSYEPPDHEPFNNPDSLPSIADFSGGIKWLFNKNQQ